MKLTKDLLEHFKKYKTSLKVDGILFVIPSHLVHKCNGCGACCKVNHASIAKEEIEEIKKLGYEGFYEENKERVTGFMLKRVNEKCFFLDDDNKCKIYENRPITCRIYPYKFTICDFSSEEKHNFKLGAVQEVEGLKDSEESICGGWKKEFVTKQDLKKAAKDLSFALKNLHLIVGEEKAKELKQYI